MCHVVQCTKRPASINIQMECCVQDMRMCLTLASANARKSTNKRKKRNILAEQRSYVFGCLETKKKRAI